jgi:hypothetical protein
MSARTFPRMLGGLFLTAALCGTGLTATAANAADFSGKKVTIIVPFKEGGAASKYARTFQPFLNKYLPGNPTVLVLNKPGGGSILGANYFQKQPGDGLTLLAVSTSTLTNFVFGGAKVKFNPNDWRIIIANPLGTAIYARPDQTGVLGKNIKNDVEALRKTDLVFGAKNKTAAELRMFMAFDLLGFFPKSVFGLSSSRQRKGILRGELNLNYDTVNKYEQSVVKWDKKGTVRLFLNLGVLSPEGKVVKDPALGDRSPSILEAYRATYGKEPSGMQWEVMKSLIAMGVSASKSMALPPKTSDDIYNTYLETVKKVYEDKTFLKAIAKDMGKYKHYLGKDAQSVIKFAVTISPEQKKWMDDWLVKKFGSES